MTSVLEPSPHAPLSSETGAPDFVVIDVETACSRVSSICQVGIVGFRNGVEVFEYETLVDPLDRFSPFNIRVHGDCVRRFWSRASAGDRSVDEGLNEPPQLIQKRLVDTGWIAPSFLVQPNRVWPWDGAVPPGWLPGSPDPADIDKGQEP